jgi:hypothetical protein
MPPRARQPIASKESFLDLHFPLKGLDLSQAFGLQPPDTTPVATNVRAYEPGTLRARGGQRPGLSKYITAQVNGSHLIQDINYVVGVGYTSPAAQQSATIVQTKLSVSGSGSSAVGTFTLAVTQGNTIVVMITAVGASTITGVSDGTNTYSKADGATNGTQHSEIWYASNVAGGPTTVTISFSGSLPYGINLVEITGPASSLDTHNNNTGSGTSANPGAVTNVGPGELAFIQIQSNGTGSITEPTGYTELTSSVANSGASAYGALSQSATITPTWAIPSATWAACIAVFKAIPAAAQSSASGRIVSLASVSNQALYVAQPSGSTWTPAVNSSGHVFGATALTVCRSTQLNQKLWYVDGSNYLTYDPSTNTVTSWAATTGTLPADVNGNIARLICTWRGRIVLSGLLLDGQNWFMLAVGDPLNANYFPVNIVPTQAVAGNNSPLGKIGDIITALVPYSDDTLIFGGDHTIWICQGDPMEGGSINLVSNDIGFAFGNAWCKDPYGTVYFLSNKTGIYSMQPGQMPVRISQQIEAFLQTVNTGANLVTFLWDDLMQGVHVFVTPTASALPATHLFWEMRTGGWIEDAFANNNHNPLCCCTFDGNTAGDRRPLIGSWDGYVRELDPSAVKDDGTAISSAVMLGPMLTRDLDDVMTKDLQAVLGELSGQVSFDVYVGTTAEKALTSNPVVSGTWKAGRNLLTPIRRAGHAVYVRISATNYWAMETVRARVEAKYRVRQRGR